MGRIHLAERIHRHFLGLLLAAYAIAAIWPWLGGVARQTTLANISAFHESIVLSLPMIMLAFLLFNAGLGAEASDLVRAARKPRVVMLGLIANVFVPVALLFVLFQALRGWPDADEVQGLLIGLAIVVAMPIAGSSAAWSQNANGNTALSLGLVILSTLLSPLTTPLTLAALQTLATGDSVDVFKGLSGGGMGGFLLMCVVVPSLTGLAVRQAIGKEWVLRHKPTIKFWNNVVLLTLCYINASSAMPQIVTNPDWDFLALALAAVTVMCVSAFVTGWLLSLWLRTDEPQQRSLMFGLGMNNNGTGMVLAGASLGSMPFAMLPVLAYNLVQHLVAGAVARMLRPATHV